ncbi:MAG: hypothetical protein C4576_19385 [Desulfobacteraceae bacterium]|nr:MAG: hypothetical protein C4576_19385 [Desulfobacteraceae bacterium]
MKRDLDMELKLEGIRSKLKFLGLCLTSSDAMDGIPENALAGAGQILIELSEEVEAITKKVFPAAQAIEKEAGQGVQS